MNNRELSATLLIEKGKSADLEKRLNTAMIDILTLTEQ